MTTPILDFVRARVDAYQASGDSLTDLARAAGVPYSWLRMFASGRIPNPGVRPIQKLADHFNAEAKAAA